MIVLPRGASYRPSPQELQPSTPSPEENVREKYDGGGGRYPPPKRRGFTATIPRKTARPEGRAAQGGPRIQAPASMLSDKGGSLYPPPTEAQNHKPRDLGADDQIASAMARASSASVILPRASRAAALLFQYPALAGLSLIASS